MRDFDPVQSAVHEKVKENQEYKLIEQIRKIRGLKLYSFNPETDEVALVPMVRQAAIGTDGKKKVGSKTMYNPKLFYVQALNEANAVRKFYNIIVKLVGPPKQ